MVAAAALAAVSLSSAPRASADVVERTGVTEFDVATVFRSFFGGSSRNIVEPGGSGRYQVNGDRNNSAQNVFGIYTVFDIPTADLAGDTVTDLASLSLSLPPAARTDNGEGGIQDAGDLSIWFTTNADPISNLEFVSESGPPFTTPTGFGDQFDDRVLLSSGFEAEGVRTIERDLAFDAATETQLLAAINAGEPIRLLLASQDPGAVFQFGTGNPPSSTILPFAGDAPTVAFDLTVVPEPTLGLGLVVLTAGGLMRRRS
ncbi:MAG: hypothetical protein AAGK78_08870 [Planctomycetota bacterium]